MPSGEPPRRRWLRLTRGGLNVDPRPGRNPHAVTCSAVDHVSRNDGISCERGNNPADSLIDLTGPAIRKRELYFGTRSRHRDEYGPSNRSVARGIRRSKQSRSCPAQYCCKSASSLFQVWTMTSYFSPNPGRLRACRRTRLNSNKLLCNRLPPRWADRPSPYSRQAVSRLGASRSDHHRWRRLGRPMNRPARSTSAQMPHQTWSHGGAHYDDF
jgi:hypothetical protein